METMEIDKMCRACLRKDDKMVDMSEKAIYEKFLLFANLTIEEDIPDISPNLCQSCEQKLNISYDFKDECQKSHEILLNYVKNARNVDSKAQIPLNDVKTPSPIAIFSQSLVSEAIKELRRSCYKNLTCIRCSFVGRDFRTLCQHMSRMHKDLQSRWCRVCNAEFDNLTDHVATNHSDNYTCKFCSKKFQSMSIVVKHLRSHSDLKPFRCSICEKGFLNQCYLNSHLSNHPKEKLHKCDLCDKSFTQMLWLNNHLKHHKTEGDAEKQPAALDMQVRTHTSEKPYVCHVCERGFAQTNALQLHMMVHNIKLKISCNICNKKFSKRYYLLIHLRKHTGEKPFVCTQCGKGFTNRSNLVRHNKIHSNLRLAALELKKDEQMHTRKAFHKCRYCEKKFKTPSLLVRHERTHTGEKPYVCQVCGTSFAQTSALNHHMMIHNIGPNKTSCDICNKKFNNMKYLLIHLRKHTGEKPFVCTECGKSFIQSPYLVEHQKTHSNVRPYQCNNCYKTFREKYYLKRHMMIHSEEKPYKCNQCAYACRIASNLTKHITKKHEVDKPRADRPHVCLMCNRGFSTNAMLTCHINRHNVSFLAI